MIPSASHLQELLTAACWEFSLQRTHSRPHPSLERLLQFVRTRNSLTQNPRIETWGFSDALRQSGSPTVSPIDLRQRTLRLERALTQANEPGHRYDAQELKERAFALTVFTLWRSIVKNRARQPIPA